VSVSGPF